MTMAEGSLPRGLSSEAHDSPESLLGLGLSGCAVRLARVDATGELVAVKVLRRSLLKRQRVGRFGNALDTLRKEIAVMKKVNHPNCVKLFEVIDNQELDVRRDP